MTEKEITLEVKNPQIIVLLLFLGLIFIMELQVTFSTPISFGDEGFHTRMAQWIGENREYPVWVPFTQTISSKTAFFQHPFWNLLEGSFFFLIGFNEAIVNFLTPMIAMLTGLGTYFFAKKFYNDRVGFIAAIMIVTIPSFVTYSVLFYTDILLTFLMVMFMYMFALSIKTGRRLHMLGAGTFGALVFMTKLTGYLVYAVVATFFLYYFIKKKKVLPLIKQYTPMFLMLVLIPGAFFIRNYSYYGTPICADLPLVGSLFDRVFDRGGCSIGSFEPQYEYAGRTEGVGTESDVFTMGIMNYLQFAYGNVWFMVFAFFAGLFMVFYTKIINGGSLNTTDIILLIILLLFIPLFLISTKRAEDTARYSLMWVPIISIVAAVYLEETYTLIKSYQKHIALIVFVLVLYIGYTNATSKLVGMSQVKRFSPLFFEACDWIKVNTAKDTVLSTLWSYRTAYSCQRNVAANPPDIMLSNNVTHVLSTVEELGVTHIFIQKFSIDYQNRHLSEMYDWNLVEFLENNPEHFKKIFENGPDINICTQQGGCDGNILYEINQ